MKLPAINHQYLIGGAVLAVIAYVYFRGASKAGQDLGGAVVGAANGAIGGAVEAVGGVFGLPATDPTRCAQAKAAGSLWETSLYCSGADFHTNLLGWYGDKLALGVETIGGAVGVPRTEATACERAKAEGRTWDASFACPASDFLKFIVR